MIEVTLSIGARDAYTHHVGKFARRKEAFREAKRAAGINPTFFERPEGVGYNGPNGTAWIVL
jgi:hypothetical protein